MPSPQMFTNIAVLNQARKIYNRKVALARETAEKIPKPLDKNGNPAKLDTRHPMDIAALVIDTKNFPEENWEQLFAEEADKMTRAFYTLDKNTDMPYPDAIKPYIRMVYEKMTCDMNINWDSVEEVENLLATQKASQSFATFVEDFPDIVFELYPDIADIRRLDTLTAKSSLIVHDAKRALSDKPDPDAKKISSSGTFGVYDSAEIRLISELGHPVFDARIKGSDVIHLDATASDLTMRFFLGMDFETEINGDYYNTDTYSKAYVELLARNHKHTSVEQGPDLMIAKGTGENDLFAYERLFINGKSVREIIRELNEDQNETLFNAQAIAGKMLTKALTDGKSIVTMMQVVTGKDGKTEFNHQEIKVDLNALNKADKKENNYSRFRRFLDLLHIYKIKRFKTNDERDAAQSKLRNNAEFQSALRAAEEKFINLYNSDQVQEEISKHRPNLKNVVPRMVRAEEVEKEKPAVSDPDRTPFTDFGKDLETVVNVESKHEEFEKTLSNGQKTI